MALPIEVFVTGTRWGLGEAIVRTVPDGYQVIGAERLEGERGFPDSSYMEEIIDCIDDGGVMVFVNNTYGAYDIKLGEDPNPQLTLFYEILRRWQRHPNKTIINVCSMAAYYAQSPVPDIQSAVWQRRYRSNKQALLRASEQATLDTKTVKCRVSAICPGHVATQRTDTPKHANTVKMDPSVTAQYVWWLIQQPQTMRIPSLALFETNSSGNIVNDS